MKSEAVTCDLTELCQSLYRIAQKHIPATAFGDTNELLHIASILQEIGIPLNAAPKLKAQLADHMPAVTRQSADYRMLKAQFRAALSTIADLGRKRGKTHKSEYHAGIHIGLRRAAKIAIAFLADFEDSAVPLSDKSATHNSLVR